MINRERSIEDIAKGLYLANNPSGLHKTAWKIYLGMATLSYDVMKLGVLQESMEVLQELLDTPILELHKGKAWRKAERLCVEYRG